MKKLNLIIFVILVFLLLSSCNNPYSSKNCPYDFPNTKWVSEKPDIYFTVDEENQCYGVVNTDEETFNISVGFCSGPTIGIYYIDENSITDDMIYVTNVKSIHSSCKYYEDKLVILDIDSENDTIFNGKYDKITFVRQDLDEETSESE